MWLVVANPASGNGRVGRLLERIEQKLRQAGISFELKTSTRPREATEIVKNTLSTEGGCRKIIGIGGDGTMNEIVNGIFSQTSIPTQEVTFTMLPIGTGNDWASTHGLRGDMDYFLKILTTGHTRLLDVGVVEYSKNNQIYTHYFANGCGMGYDALVVKSVESQQSYVLGKKIAYFLHILKCLWQYRPEKARIIFNNETIEDYFYTINIGINKTSGGGIQMTPQAVNDDGLLALTLIRNMPKWRVLLYTTKLYNGTIGEITRFVSLHQTPLIVAEGLSAPLYIETDGELLGHTPLSIRTIERGLCALILT